jgi:transcriptional regulator with PAS, ATPase and Fis domain
MLAHHFLDFANRKMNRKVQGFTNAAMDRLVRAEWTGNVRELENEVERIVALAGDADTVTVDMLSEHLRQSSAPAEVPGDAGLAESSLNGAVDALKRRMIADAIRETGSKTQASAKLGIPRQSLQKMMKRLGLS